MNSKIEHLNIQLPYPCDWQIDNGQNENVIRKFRKIKDNGSAIEEMLVVTDMNMKLSKTKVKKLLSKENLSEALDLKKDKEISFERLLIDGVPSAKMSYKSFLNNQKDTMWAFIVQYCMVYKNYLVRLQFGTFEPNEYVIQYNLHSYENQELFDKIVSQIKFENNN